MNLIAGFTHRRLSMRVFGAEAIISRYSPVLSLTMRTLLNCSLEITTTVPDARSSRNWNEPSVSLKDAVTSTPLRSEVV